LNRALASIGLALAVVGAFFFYGVFVGLTPGFLSFLLALVLVPVGSGVLFFGAAYRRPYMAQQAAMGGPSGGTSGTVWAALAVAVVAILIAVASLSVAYQAQSSASQNTGVSALSTSLSSALASLGSKPTTVAYKVDWCNTDNTGEDRFCPNQLVVNQGDIVQIMFIHNDTDVHTFTLDTSPYFFQINDSTTGMHNFITNANLAGACSNTGTYAQQSAAISGVYCVSGSSLLAPAGNFKIAQNSNPAAPGNGSNGISLVDVKMDNTVHVVNFNFTSGASEVWGVGSFQATQPGIYEFFCHYHVSNGMFGYLVVLPNPYCQTSPSSCGDK
jgi:plastocyanin